MRTRSLGLTLFSGLAILLSACSNTGSGASAGASAAPDPCAGAGAGPAHTQPTDWAVAMGRSSRSNRVVLRSLPNCVTSHAAPTGIRGPALWT